MAQQDLPGIFYASDRPDLFARICGYFDRAGFSIQDAKVHTSRNGYALDTFQVVHPNCEPGDAGAYRDLIALVEHQLVAALASHDELNPPSRGRLSRMPAAWHARTHAPRTQPRARP